MFVYVQCDLSVPDELKAKIPDICGRKRFVETTATNVDIELQVNQRTTYHTIFQVLLGSWKIHRFVQNTPRKVLNSFIQSVVDARRAGDENPLSGVVAETMKHLRSSSYGYQNIQ